MSPIQVGNVVGLFWRAMHYYVRKYAKISVVRMICDFSYVLFTISSLLS